MSELFHTVVYLPIYNLLVFLLDIVPGGDLGLAVIGATIVVKIVLLPLSLSAVRTQRAMKLLEPELKELKEKYKDDKEAHARETFALYKKNDVKPFASILMLFVQLPILFGLYFVTQHAAQVDPALLYPFVHMPAVVSPLFLGIFALTGTGLVLALAAAATQLLQAWYMIPVPPKSTSATPSMQEEFGRAVSLQARFVFPLLIGFIAFSSGVLALYFIASNLFMVVQELVVRGPDRFNFKKKIVS
jgi:YidC/Oxa1 family membrane protein insertase